jgi:hypothetical protein
MEGFSMSTNRNKPPGKTGKKTRGGVIWRGWAAPDDPIYTGGWKFILGKNLNPSFVRKSLEEAEKSPPQNHTARPKPERRESALRRNGERP